MKKKSIFGGILMLILIGLICVLLTVTIALLVGSTEVEIFDFSNLNFSNMIPVLIIGGMISCFVVGIAFLFLGRTIFFKAKDYFFEKDKKEDKEKE